MSDSTSSIVAIVAEAGVPGDDRFYKVTDPLDEASLREQILHSLGLPTHVNLVLGKSEQISQHYSIKFTIDDPIDLQGANHRQIDSYRWHRIIPTFSGAGWSSSDNRFAISQFVPTAKHRIAELFWLFDRSQQNNVLSIV
jgi:hypothetical protein